MKALAGEVGLRQGIQWQETVAAAGQSCCSKPRALLASGASGLFSDGVLLSSPP